MNIITLVLLVPGLGVGGWWIHFRAQQLKEEENVREEHDKALHEAKTKQVNSF